jgi:hypothetical protein
VALKKEARVRERCRTVVDSHSLRVYVLPLRGMVGKYISSNGGSARRGGARTSPVALVGSTVMHSHLFRG